MLQPLLRLAGRTLSVEEVVERMHQALTEDRSAGAVIPAFFLGEPRFPDPSIAKRLYENLLGLWDLVESGKPFTLGSPASVLRPPKVRPLPPRPFGDVGPDAYFVERSWRYLEDLDKRGTDRLQHQFENRQDALASFLEEQPLAASGFTCARLLVFELFAMIELGWPAGMRPVVRSELEQAEPDSAELPVALADYAEQEIFEAEQDEETPLSAEECKAVRAVVFRCLRALWAARRR